MIKNLVTQAVKGALEAIGIEVRQNHLQNLKFALRHHITSSNPRLFDVGANEGQTVRLFKKLVPRSEVHAFEPNPIAFEQLRSLSASYDNLILNMMGVGDKQERLRLQINADSVLTSFLEPGRHLWSQMERTVEVPVTTIDAYCLDHDIGSINLLKTDTQGFDHRVIEGSKDMVYNNKIQAILTEVTFIPLYDGQPPAFEYLDFLSRMGFQFVGFYNFGYRHDQTGWCDALFVNPSFEAFEMMAADQK